MILYPRNRLASFFVHYRNELVLGGVLFLTASLSFGLGYTMAQETKHAPIIIEKNSQQ